MASVDVAIIGAGPYGLSLATHLMARRVSFRIFGAPMAFWSNNMPKGMWLKSDWFASNLVDAEGEFTYERFCQERQISYGSGIPVRLDHFIDYALKFQAQMVPDVEQRNVTAVTPTPVGFTLTLDGDEQVEAKRVVVAIGMKDFSAIPANLAHFPSDLLSHSSAQNDLGQHKGRSIIVVGGGASAVDLAALLHEAGAEVQLIARRPSLAFHGGSADGSPRSLWQQIKRPTTGLGPGWRSVFYSHLPWLFRRLPASLRVEVVRRAHGPAAGWFVRDRVVGRVPIHLGFSVTNATVRNGKAEIGLEGPEGKNGRLVCDHLIAATGYKVDLERLTFLSTDIRSRLKAIDKSPVLSADFQSSVRGLYFIGIAAANTFGPVMRFVYGAGFTARRLSRALSRHRASREAP